MTYVRMRVQITGTRDGADWPPPGAVLEVSEEEAQHLLQMGVADHGGSNPEVSHTAPTVDEKTGRPTATEEEAAAMRSGAEPPGQEGESPAVAIEPEEAQPEPAQVEESDQTPVEGQPGSGAEAGEAPVEPQPEPEQQAEPAPEPQPEQPPGQGQEPPEAARTRRGRMGRG